MGVFLPLTEDIEKYRTVDRSRITDLKVPGKFNKEEKRKENMSLASGNAFESLAHTNPELVNNKKLEEIRNSKNIVEDFNTYYYEMIDTAGTNIAYEMKNKTMKQKNHNIIIRSIMRDFTKLVLAEDLSEEEALKIVNGIYIPEAMTPEGCRALIDTRIANNRMLTTMLQECIKSNYTMLNLNEAEAYQLIGQLGDSEESGKAIAKIQAIIDKPEVLAKFQVKQSVFDFRSIGGGVLIMSHDEDIHDTAHPKKLLNDIFKYDAIVFSHGSSGKERNKFYRYQRKNIIETMEDYKDNINKFLNGFDEYYRRHVFDITEKYGLRYYGSKLIKNPNILKKYKYTKEEIESLNYGEDVSSNNNAVKALNDIQKSIKSLNTKFAKELLYYIGAIINDSVNARKYVDGIIKADSDFKSKYTEITGFDDIEEVDISSYDYWDISSLLSDCRDIAEDSTIDFNDRYEANRMNDWTCQPVDTLSANNLSSVVEIIIQLKHEGFKNIKIWNCNPASVQLPDSIVKDKSIKVWLGDHSVLKEGNTTFYSENELDFHTIDELYVEYAETMDLYNEAVLLESPLDVLKSLAEKAIDIIKKIWEKLKDFFRFIARKIKEFFVGKPKADSAKKELSKPIKVTFITLQGEKAVQVTKDAKTLEEARSMIEEATNGLGKFLEKKSAKENSEIAKLKAKIPGLIEKNNKAKEELKSKNEAYTNNLRRRYLLEGNDDNDTPDYTKDDNDAAGNAADGDNPTDYTIPDDDGSGEDNDTAEQADDNDTPDYTKDGDNEGNDDNPDAGGDDIDTGGDPGGDTGGGDPEGDTGDDEGGDADTEGDDDYGSDEPSSNEDDNPVLKLQKDIFSDLSEEQMAIKDKELRKRFYTMYDSIDNIIERINNIPKTTAIIKPIEFVSRKLDETSSLLNDYITATYDTLSYVENEINYNKFFAILSGISQAIEGIANQANTSKK